MTTEKTATEIALERLESALADLRAHRADYHPNTFRLVEEPITEEIERCRLLLAEQRSASTTSNAGAGNVKPLTHDPDRQVVPD